MARSLLLACHAKQHKVVQECGRVHSPGTLFQTTHSFGVKTVFKTLHSHANKNSSSAFRCAHIILKTTRMLSFLCEDLPLQSCASSMFSPSHACTCSLHDHKLKHSWLTYTNSLSVFLLQKVCPLVATAFSCSLQEFTRGSDRSDSVRKGISTWNPGIEACSAYTRTAAFVRGLQAGSKVGRAAASPQRNFYVQPFGGFSREGQANQIGVKGRTPPLTLKYSFDVQSPSLIFFFVQILIYLRVVGGTTTSNLSVPTWLNGETCSKCTHANKKARTPKSRSVGCASDIFGGEKACSNLRNISKGQAKEGKMVRF